MPRITRCMSLRVAAAALAFAPGALAGQDSAAVPVVVSDTLRFTSISTGGSHSCGVTAERRAYCWGRNEVGQLGDSTTTDRATPVPVAGGIAFRLLTAGDHHTCGITTDDHPYCWGGNERGQLGIGTTTNQAYPIRVSGDLRVVVISAGGQHTCASRRHYEKQDRVMCWGSNTHGQLGSMSTSDVYIPIETFGVIHYTSLATGALHTCGSTRQGKVFCWGANRRGQLGVASLTDSWVPFIVRMNRRVDFATVALGTAHSCALTTEAEAYCWGESAAGQVGTGKKGRVLSPTLLKDPLGFTALSAGGDVTCGLRKDGSASCWGSNATGQFGTPTATGSPVPAPALPGATLTAISLGLAHGCGLRPDGAALCWGGVSQVP